ncbi:N-acetylmuramoyl-L-alanine amidase [Nonomuraea sp. PA05]|uniref:peptidoglycan recognition protein family protein n=1 Tax=Nonomuraea sp. PA05 TaxID=2604466 RepID=UPI0011D3F52D|nr:N-acetylmuramoyl-L-alanine amidase [Nonomuraea sp. PA05]TYB50224.1 N-acetylmuramoyl-L-alanine amidase [Nonomuraea sp. PA05]
MPWLTRLATVARRTGFPVIEVDGWKSRGHGPQPEVQGVVCHHTAGPAAGGDYPSLKVVRDGRPGLDGPLSQYGLGRSGTIYVIAAGRCWHNAPSTSPLHDNSSSIGIEAENNGRQAWPTAQLLAYRRLCAEICREYGLPASRVKAHREVNTGKPDPHGIDMTDFRADVARLLAGRAPALSESWTEELVDNLPTLKPGSSHARHVKTMRGLLWARGYEPANMHATRYGANPDDLADLKAQVNAYKKAHGLAEDGVWGDACWKTALS